MYPDPLHILASYISCLRHPLTGKFLHSPTCNLSNSFENGFRTRKNTLKFEGSRAPAIWGVTSSAFYRRRSTRATGISAQLKGNPDNVCRNGYFPRESTNYRLAKIRGADGDRSALHSGRNETCAHAH